VSTDYDQAYFDKWYRHPHHRVKTSGELRRQVAFVLGMAEWVLGRPVTSVLDVGCGEGQWLPALRRLRPRVHYDGVDPSAYAVARYGQRRRLQQGGIEQLETLALRPAYDLVVCCGMLNYLSPKVLRAGLAQVARRTDGVAYLELFTRADRIEGDTNWPTPRTGAWYRVALRSAGFTSIGMHGYVPTAQQSRVAVLERSG
jgi:SAM-dependent methyltransferase